MCLAAILVKGLNPSEKRLLQDISHGRPVGLAVLNQYGGVPVIRQLQVLRLARQMPNDLQYGKPRWILTECGQRAGRFLQEIEQNPLLEGVITDDYNRQRVSCPATRRANPDWCQCDN